MLGIFGVGKTSLTQRFVYNRFDEKYLSTIGVKVSQKLLPAIEISDNTFVQLNLLIWDIEGLESASRNVSNYFLGASGAFLVGDLTREASLEALPVIATRFRESAPDAKLVLLGNKSDLTENDGLPAQRLQEIGDTLEAPCFLTSAKTGQNVEQAFLRLGLLIAK